MGSSCFWLHDQALEMPLSFILFIWMCSQWMHITMWKNPLVSTIMHSNFCIYFLVWPKFGRIYKIPFYRFILFVVGHLTTITYLDFWQGNQIHIPVLVTECNSKSKHLLECTIALLNVVMCTLLQIRVRQQQWFAMLHIGGGCLPRSFNYGWSEISTAATAGTFLYTCT